MPWKPSWRAGMHGGRRRIRAEFGLRRAARLLRRSPLFDADWYLATYPDVAAAGLDPVRHYLRSGAAEGRDPGPRFSSRDYLGRHPDVAAAGINPLLHHLRHAAHQDDASAMPAPGRAIPDLVPLHGFRVPRGGGRRVTLLTDSLASDSLFGGVVTALLFATLAAERLGAGLRIVTETAAPDAAAAARLLRTHGVAPPAEIACAFADRRRADRRDLDVHDGDIFVSTAWWNTWNLLHAVAPRQVIHLLQDDERMFYPHGDAHLACAEVLATPGLRVAVNTRLLHAHLLADGFAGLARQGAWFEPAFPLACYRWEDRAEPERRGFIFHARPDRPRNLYRRGVDAICAAIERRILDPDRWTVSFVGRNLPAIALPCGVQPRLLQHLSWAEYAALLRRSDLGLCLMHSPHPSYPPLDLAASGAVAVTNRYGSKQSLAQYSANIICVDSALDALLEGLEQGVRLAADLPARRRNYVQSRLGRDWSVAFRPAFERLLVP